MTVLTFDGAKPSARLKWSSGMRLEARPGDGEVGDKN